MRGRRRAQQKLVLALLLAAAVPAGVGLAVLKGSGAYAEVQSEASAGERALSQGAAQLHGLNLGNAGVRLAGARAEFRSAAGHFRAAEDRLQGDPLFGLASVLAAADRQRSAGLHLLHIGIGLSDFGDRAAGLGLQALRLTRQKTSKTAAEEAADFVQANVFTVEALDRELTAISQEREGIPGQGLAQPLTQALKRLDEKLAHLREVWREVPSAIGAAQFLLGVDQPRTFLVIDLDSAELRSAGGFIGSFGYLHIAHGKIERIQFRDVYSLHEPGRKPGDLGYIAPPLPLARHLNPNGLGLRDATWWPDFPTSASQVEYLLKLDEGTSVDGVIGINPYFVADLLQIAGPVTVPWLNDTFDANNFYIKSIFHSGLISPGPNHQRKDFLGFIGNELHRRLSATSSDRLPAIGDGLRRACLRRDIQVAFHDSAANRLAEQFQCRGAMIHTEGDFLLITSAISGAKNNAWLERSADLKVSGGPSGSLRHELHLHFVNKAPRFGSYIIPYYDDYIRIFIPSGSTWLNANASGLGEQVFVPRSDGGYAEIGGWFRTIRDVADITLVYDVAPTHAGELTWQRQSGTGDDPVTISVSLEESRSWSFILDRDRRFPLSGGDARRAVNEVR